MKIFTIYFLFVGLYTINNVNGKMEKMNQGCLLYEKTYGYGDIYTDVDILPIYSDGKMGFYSYLKEGISLEYNENKELKLSYQFYFIIDVNGKVTDVWVEGSGVSEFERMIINRIKNCKKWAPAKCGDEDVNFLYKLPLRI